MIVNKNEDGTFTCEASGNFFKIPSKEFYLSQKAEIEAIKQPSDEELIELGRQSHPYYSANVSLENVINQLAEIEAFENQ